MMGVTFQQQKLRAGFTFRIVEAIKRIKINPISQTKTIPWRVSLVLGMIAVAIGLNPQLFTLELFNPGMDLSLIGESKVLDVGDIPVSIVKTAKTPLMSAQQGDSNGTNLDNMNVFSMALQAVDEWEKKADMPSGRGSTLGVINGKIYLIGGTPDALNSISDVEEYDPLADKWTKKTSMSKSRLGQASCVVNDKIYVFGGTLDRGFNWKAYSDVEEYDPLTDTWTPKSDMPAPLSYHYACEYNGKVYVFGGMADGVNDSSAMYIYDPKTDTWSQGKDAPRKRTSFSAGIVNGKIYAFGGGNPGYVVPVDEYDIAIDTWTTKTELKVLSANNSCVVINDKIYVIGGEKDNVPIDTMLIYDPIANTWEDAPSMKTPRGALAACAIDGVIYAIGGIAGFNNPISTIEVFDTGYSPVDQSAVNSQGKSPTTWGDKKK